MHILGKRLDDALAERMGRLYFPRQRRCLFAKSEDGRVWQGLAMRYFGRKCRPLSVQPYISIFCPEASAIIETGLEIIYKNPRPRYWGKFGGPLLITPLYHQAHALCNIDRLPLDYDFEEVSRVKAIADLVSSDFQAVASLFFADTTTPQALCERICATPGDSGTGASLYAMALAYRLDPGLSARDIDKLKRLWPCPMTDDFADYMKKLIAGAVTG